MRALLTIAGILTGSIALGAWLAIGETPSPLFVPFVFFYSALATLALALALVAKGVNR